MVDAVDPRVLVSECATRSFDFDSIAESELHEINIPLSFQICVPQPSCFMHIRSYVFQ